MVSWTVYPIRLHIFFIPGIEFLNLRCRSVRIMLQCTRALLYFLPGCGPHAAGLRYLVGTRQNAGTDMLTLLCCAISVSQHNYAFVKMIKDDHKNRKEKATAPAIKTYHFLTRKYGRELLLDIGRIDSLKNFIVDDTPHNISFYEILFIEKEKAVLHWMKTK